MSRGKHLVTASSYLYIVHIITLYVLNGMNGMIFFFLLLIISQYSKFSVLRRLRPTVSFPHIMISPDLKNLFQSVESVFCVPEDTEQWSFAANLLKAVQSKEIASKIKLLADKLDFVNSFMDFGDEHPGTIYILDVDIVFNKDHLEVEKRVCIP